LRAWRACAGWRRGGTAERRAATIVRETKETRVEATLDLDGSGQSSAKTGIGMLDHLVEQIGKHGLFDLRVTATGDLHVDEHHTVEDVGIAIGQALDRALGERRASCAWQTRRCRSMRRWRRWRWTSAGGPSAQLT
jgi:imidazoleglycerol phosphate dehydratase HisB